MVSDNIAAIPLRAGSGPDDRALARVFTAYIVSATIWLVFATAVGLLVSFKFVYPDFATAPARSIVRPDFRFHISSRERDAAVLRRCGGCLRASIRRNSCLPSVNTSCRGADSVYAAWRLPRLRQAEDGSRRDRPSPRRATS